MERIFLYIQDKFFSENGIKNIYKITIILFIVILVFGWKNLLYTFNNDKLNKLVQLNNNLFNLSGILAGFIFASLGLIGSADNKLIEDLKDTKNFSILGNFYVYSILNYILVIFISLIESFILNKNFIILLFVIKIFSFIFATILFLITLYFTKAMLFKNSKTK